MDGKRTLRALGVALLATIALTSCDRDTTQSTGRAPAAQAAAPGGGVVPADRRVPGGGIAIDRSRARYDDDVRANDETRGQQIGSVVSPRGPQAVPPSSGVAVAPPRSAVVSPPASTGAAPVAPPEPPAASAPAPVVAAAPPPPEPVQVVSRAAPPSAAGAASGLSGTGGPTMFSSGGPLSAPPPRRVDPDPPAPVVAVAPPPPPAPAVSVAPVPPPTVTAVPVTAPAPAQVYTPPAAAPAPTQVYTAPVPAPVVASVPQPSVAPSGPGILSSVPPTAYAGGPLQVAVIQFGQGASGLSGEDRAVLRDVAQIQKRSGGVIRVYAHASNDVAGTSVRRIKTGNLDVSVKRGGNVASELRRLGVPANAIVMEALSDEEPIYETRTARGMAANRRAEIFLDF